MGDDRRFLSFLLRDFVEICFVETWVKGERFSCFVEILFMETFYFNLKISIILRTKINVSILGNKLFKNIFHQEQRKYYV